MATGAAELALHYERALEQRMLGLPFLNDRLRVEPVGFGTFGEHEIGVLITPWFMNLYLLPGSDRWNDCTQGSLCKVTLPAGAMDFNVSHDDELGTLLSAVLFTTVEDFPDQSTARAVAAEIMRELLDDTGVASRRPTMSRRAFLSQRGA